MFQDLFSSSQLLDLPLLTMLGFFATFGGIVVWALTTRRRPHFDRMARLPIGSPDEEGDK